MCSRGHWRPSEDEKLRELVERYGPHNWNSIAEKLQGRSGKSCRLRWFNQLDPRIKRTPFTDEEEERLLSSHRLHGNRWSIIARLFPGRTDNAVKNHFHVIMARKCRERSSRTDEKGASQTVMTDKRGCSLMQNAHLNCESKNYLPSYAYSSTYAHSPIFRDIFIDNTLFPQVINMHPEKKPVEFYNFLNVNTDSNTSEMTENLNKDDNDQVEQERPFIDFLPVENSCN